MDTDEVLGFYNSGIEKGRLHTNIGLIEFARTKEILMDLLPPPPAVIYDIGGGFGEYAWYLVSLGYRVHLFDFSETNIRMAEDLSALYPGVTLEEKTVADARSITRFATTLWVMSVYGGIKAGGEKNDLLHEPAFVEMIEREICDGQHIRPENSAYHGMTHSFFHNNKKDTIRTIFQYALEFVRQKKIGNVNVTNSIDVVAPVFLGGDNIFGVMVRDFFQVSEFPFDGFLS